MNVSEHQQLEINKKPEWDEIDLSNPERRKECLQILLCQQVQRGQDISLCIQAINYLNSLTVQDKLHKIIIQVAQEKTIFTSLQRVCVISFAILGMIAFLGGVTNSWVRSPADATPIPQHESH